MSAPRCRRCKEVHGTNARCADILSAELRADRVEDTVGVTTFERQPPLRWYKDCGPFCSCMACVMRRIAHVRRRRSHKKGAAA